MNDELDECEGMNPSDNPEAALDKLIADTQDEELRKALQVVRKHMNLKSKIEDRTNVIWSIDGAGDAGNEEDETCILFGIAWW